MSEEIKSGSIMKEVHMKLEPSGFSEPTVIDLTVQFADSKTINFGFIRHKTFYHPNEVGVVQSLPEIPDSLQQIRRFGICRAQDLEEFKLKMKNDMHDALVRYRDDLKSMQEHLNSQLPQEVDESVTVDWDRYRCKALSGWTQDIGIWDEIHWDSTDEAKDTLFVEIYDNATEVYLYAKGLEGLEDTGIINRIKKAIREHEETISKIHPRFK